MSQTDHPEAVSVSPRTHPNTARHALQSFGADWPEWAKVAVNDVIEQAARAADSAPTTAGLEPCWFCERAVGIDNLIAGYDTWDEQRLACLDCDRAIHALYEKGWLPADERRAIPQPGGSEPVEGLGAAWKEAEAALPGSGRDYWLELIGGNVETRAGRFVVYAKHAPNSYSIRTLEYGQGHTPAAALRDIAARLQAESAGEPGK